EKVLVKLDKAVCLGLRLSASVLDEITVCPTRLYFHHYRTVNASLDQLTLKIANFIQRKGFQALPIPASIILDWENQRAHLSHKKLGVLAGLGWIGRNNLLVTKKFGSRVRLSTVLTDMPLPADSPCKEDCGTCRACVARCPAGAIKESPADFDHLKCFEKLKEFYRARLAEQYICGVCVRSCGGTAGR
ncbi:MAG: reductive dehalogenase domain-containing protein, partial [Candidatus Omnitrophota bacterium]